jgi:hypothetical protein
MSKEKENSKEKTLEISELQHSIYLEAYALAKTNYDFYKYMTNLTEYLEKEREDCVVCSITLGTKDAKEKKEIKSFSDFAREMKRIIER